MERNDEIDMERKIENRIERKNECARIETKSKTELKV